MMVLFVCSGFCLTLCFFFFFFFFFFVFFFSFSLVLWLMVLFALFVGVIYEGSVL